MVGVSIQFSMCVCMWEGGGGGGVVSFPDHCSTPTEQSGSFLCTLINIHSYINLVANCKLLTA